MKIGGVDFDNISYDSDGDVLYLHAGDPGDAVDFDATPEGHATRYDARGNLVGLTIVGARQIIEASGEIAITLPEHRVVASGIAALVAA